MKADISTLLKPGILILQRQVLHRTLTDWGVAHRIFFLSPVGTVICPLPPRPGSLETHISRTHDFCARQFFELGHPPTFRLIVLFVPGALVYPVCCSRSLQQPSRGTHRVEWLERGDSYVRCSSRCFAFRICPSSRRSFCAN